MADDEQQKQNGEQPEETPAEEPKGEEETPKDVGAPAAGADEQASSDEGSPGVDVPSDAEGEPKKEKEKKPEVVPGAELDPIAIEPERELSAEERARQEAEAEERARRERELIGEATEEGPVATKPATLSGDARFLATGKRKSSVARVVLTPGSGDIRVNRRTLEEYFPRPYLQSVAKQPLVQTGYEGNVNVQVRVHGGGISGQASAVRHGIARALSEVDPELRLELKRRGMLTRDARVKERRKAGLKKARKKPQFSKR